MAPPRKHRDKIVRAAADLFRRFGYAATGTNDIVARARAPKGSLYHYFPGGKEEIAAEAVRYAGARVCATLTELAATAPDPAGLLRAYGRLLGEWMAQSDFHDGCPIATTLLELAPKIEPVRDAGQSAFGAWRAFFVDGLRAHGVSARRAGALATLAVAGLEGALILARVERSARPIQVVCMETARLFEQVCLTPA